ncbi:hypothetical protein [Paracoccus sp. SCSIO 75233]|uniref:hypothetical protein n=1 Tax=Paracoccus sp. SCSIO 75233 TaxID=3017782 RepID=UPI0022F089BD|nr:hypothetical protein [Paracoccus sp. SCSIO 75233]WBU52564.1 hypothetical protein PAF12_12150 [Paracoccus sp. SCSIO 75233]
MSWNPSSYALALIAALGVAVVASNALRGEEGTTAVSIPIGEVADPARLHIVSRPGRYGLRPAPTGSKYAVMNGRLVRIDAESGKVQSVIRQVDSILD